MTPTPTWPAWTRCFALPWIVGSLLAVEPAGLSELWHYDFGSPVSASPALLPDGRVVVGCQGNPDPNDNSRPNIGGRLQLFAPDGRLDWGLPLAGVAVTAAVDEDGTIFVADLGTWVQGGGQYAVREGTVLWSAAQERAVVQRAAITADGTVYFITSTPSVEARAPGGGLAWELRLGQWGNLLSAPAISGDGTLYVGLAQGPWNGQLIAIAPDGHVVWSKELWAPAGAPVVGPDGTVFIGGGVPPPDPAYPPPLDKPALVAVNPDGSLRWVCKVPGRVAAAPVLGDGGELYVGADSGHFMAITRQGELVWTFNAGAPLVASAALAADGTLYFGSTNGTLQAVGSDGIQKASIQLAGEIRSSPVLGADGTLFVTTSGGTLYAFSAGAGPAASPAPFEGRNAQRDGRDRTAEVPSAPTELAAGTNPNGPGLLVTWGEPSPLLSYELRRSLGTDVVAAETLEPFLSSTDFADVTVMSGQTYRYWVRARNSRGSGDWSDPFEITLPTAGSGEIAWFFPLDQAADSVALGPDGRFYTTVTNELLAFEASGALAWRYAISKAHSADRVLFSTAPVVADSGLVLAASSQPPSVSGNLYAVDENGQLAWEFAQGSPVGPLALMPGGGLLAAGAHFEHHLARLLDDGSVAWHLSHSEVPNTFGAPSVRSEGTAFLPPGWAVRSDGTTIWSISRLGGRSTAALGRDGTAYFGTEGPPEQNPDPGRFLAVGTDGSIRWEYPCGSVASSPVIRPDDSLVFGTLAGRILCLSPAGDLVWEFEAGAPVESSPALSADGLIWCGANDGWFYALNPDGTVHWKWKLGTAVLASPAIGPDGTVHVAAADAGLYIIQGDAPAAASPWPMWRHDARRTARGEAGSLAPTAPTDVVAEEGFERGAVTVSWSPVPFAESYEVWRGTTEAFEGMTLMVEALSGWNVWADRTVQAGSIYYYRVRAENSLGLGPPSAAASGTQQARAWDIQLPAGIGNAPALAPDQSLRVTVYSLNDALWAVNPDGSIRWRAPLGRPFGHLVIGPDGTTYLDALPSEVIAVSAEGTIKWQTHVDARLASASQGASAWTLTSDGLLLVPLDSGGFLLFDPDGASTWFASNRYGVAMGTVVARDGSLLCTSSTYGAELLDRSGRQLWWVPDFRASAAAIAPNGSFICTGGNAIGSLSPEGEVNWLTAPFSLSAPPASPPVVGPDGSVYAAAGSKLTALDATGTVRWSTEAPLLLSLPLILSDGSVMVRGRDRLLAFAGDGTPLWEAVVGSPQIPLASTAVVSADGSIYAVGKSNLCKFVGTAGLPATGWPMARLNAAHTGSLAEPAPAPGPIVDPVASQGRWVQQVRIEWAPGNDLAWVEVWRAAGSDPASATLIGHALPTQFGYIDATVTPGAPFHYWLRATNTTGASALVGPVRGLASPDARFLWKYQATNETSFSTVARDSDGRLFTATTSGTLLAINADGDLAWGFDQLPPPLGDPAVAPDGTIFIYNPQYLVALEPDGGVKWQQPVSGPLKSLAIDGDGGVYLIQGQALVAYNPDGAERWRGALPPWAPGSPLVDADGRIRILANFLLTFEPDGQAGPPQDVAGQAWRTLSASASGRLYAGGSVLMLAALDRDGNVLYTLPDGDWNSLREPIVGSADTVFASSRDFSLRAVSDPGAVQWSYLAPWAGFVADASGGAIVAFTNQVVALDAEAAEQWVFEFERPSPSALPPTAPLLTEDGTFAFSSANRLFVLGTSLSPAPSGWAMQRADPQRSGRVGARIRILDFSPGTDGGWMLRVGGVSEATCTVEESADLDSWTTAAEVPVEGTVMTIQLPSVPGIGPRFYRVKTP